MKFNCKSFLLSQIMDTRKPTAVEKNVNMFISNAFATLKHEIKQIANTNNETHTKILQYICDYPTPTIGELPPPKKRVSTQVHLSDRCCALRADGKQCTRRKKNEGSEFCGTHLKGAPYGIYKPTDHSNGSQKQTVWTQDIKGIIYYIDDKGNVYATEDIVSKKTNPRIYAKYIITDGKYTLVHE